MPDCISELMSGNRVLILSDISAHATLNIYLNSELIISTSDTQCVGEQTVADHAPPQLLHHHHVLLQPGLVADVG